jgi:uncharacterized repeat protein (TIGR01451 family)
MELTKSIGPAPISAGDPVTYIITYRNASLVAPATNFTITDDISVANYLEWVSGGIHAGGTMRSGALYGGLVTWNVGNVAANSGWLSVSFTARTDPMTPKGTIIVNTAHSTTNQTGGTDFPSNQHLLNVVVPDLKLTPVTNVPNPASDSTEIIFNLTVAAKVKIKFYTISGELVRIMDDAEVVSSLMHGQTSVRSGNNSVLWDCKNKSGKLVSTGIYFYRVEAESKIGRAHV